MNVYFIHIGPEQEGPFTPEELKSKDIKKETPVWREGLSEWKKAGELPELNFLFITVPPPFVQKEELISPPPPFSQKETESISPGATTDIPSTSRKKNYLMYVLPAGIIIIAAVLYFYLSSGESKDNDANKEKEKIVAATSDSNVKKETAGVDTIKKIDLDTLSNWMATDTLATKPDDELKDQTGFTMGGIPVDNGKKGTTVKDNSKKKEKKEIPQPRETKQEQKINVTNETRETAPARPKNLQITGTFHKNLILEAVLEGRIQNPNEDISFRDLRVLVRFLGSDGEVLGTKQFAQSGTIHGGGRVSFKFKTNPPKGTKTAKYDVSGSAF